MVNSMFFAHAAVQERSRGGSGCRDPSARGNGAFERQGSSRRTMRTSQEPNDK